MDSYTRDRLKMNFGIGDETECCANCRHFILHYRRNTYSEHVFGKYTELHEGHCCYPRIKRRMVTDACDEFEKG